MAFGAPCLTRTRTLILTRTRTPTPTPTRIPTPTPTPTLARRAGAAADAPPPQASLLRLVETEWLRPCFAGALSWEAGLWALDQGVTQGWGVLAELSAACLWLLRREVRSK